MTVVDVEEIRRAYARGIEIFGRCPATRADVLELGEELRGYVDMLLPEATTIAPRMRGEARYAAVHFLSRAREILAELDQVEPAPKEEAPLESRPPMRDRDTVFELALLCRTALSVVTRPGPLGAPAGLRELQEAIDRRVCGACWEPIEDGAPVEMKTFMSEAGAGIRGYVHAELCAPRRPALITVPAQPSPA